MTGLLPPSTLDTGYLAAVRKLRVSNASAEVIPPHALLRVTGNDADGLLAVAKPNADSLPYLLVNGPLPIAAGATGLATFDEPTPVAYDDAHTPAPGDTWGSANGSWLLTKAKTGWRVMGDPDTESTVVEAVREVGGPITTANVDTTQESTTIRLEFDQDTGVRVDKGATDGDPDTVSIDFDVVFDNYGHDITYVSNVCSTLTVTKDGDGKVTDVSLSQVVQKQTVRFLAEPPLGAPVCTTSPTDCCDGVALACCDNPVPNTLYVTVSGGGGSHTLTWDAGLLLWDSGWVAVTGCDNMRFMLWCDAGTWTLQGASAPNKFGGEYCYFLAVPVDTVNGCVGADLTSLVFTAEVDASPVTNTCACDGVTKTFTVTP